MICRNEWKLLVEEQYKMQKNGEQFRKLPLTHTLYYVIIIEKTIYSFILPNRIKQSSLGGLIWVIVNTAVRSTARKQQHVLHAEKNCIAVPNSVAIAEHLFPSVLSCVLPVENPLAERR